ncbi:GNAT family N-acetyltransferase [Nonomuraea zeae]|uniref:GNAT family N-acetyltransferase n=1 Tax=Nonomuraea zeae TaxID=1642303 RepID=A0A5S4H900_9ACTN|nr:GNAT family N-acetyltransferase [Nonomuraea zeae]TMR35270.1 GNAT family N-acetyltransferase [Nonomuraea zeae]
MPRLEEITPDNLAAAVEIKVSLAQEAFVAPVVASLAEAYASRQTAWPRLVYDGDRAVAFVMANFDPGHEIEAFRCGVWRLNVAAAEQGKGYGSFAVRALCEEARRRGHRRVTVLWEPGEGGPEGFYLRLGFKRTGEVLFGETVGELAL